MRASDRHAIERRERGRRVVQPREAEHRRAPGRPRVIAAASGKKLAEHPLARRRRPPPETRRGAVPAPGARRTAREVAGRPAVHEHVDVAGPHRRRRRPARTSCRPSGRAARSAAPRARAGTPPHRGRRRCGRPAPRRRAALSPTSTSTPSHRIRSRVPHALESTCYPRVSERRPTAPRLPAQPRLPGRDPGGRPAAARRSTRLRGVRRRGRRIALVGGTVPRARPRRCPAPAAGPGRASGLLPRGPGPADDHAPPPLPHHRRRAPRARALGAERRARPPGARPHVHAAPARRDRSSSAAPDAPSDSQPGTPSTRSHVGRPARLGPDGRWSLRLGRAAPARPRPALTVRWGARRAATGILTSRAHATATLAHRGRRRRPRPRTRHLVRHPRLTPLATPVLASARCAIRDVHDAKIGGAGVSRGARRSWPCPGRRRRTSSRGRSSCRRPRAR